MNSRQQLAFNRAYHLSRHPEIQRLREMNEVGPRKERALGLMNRYVIDGDLDVMRGDPFTGMMLRKNHGYDWVPGYHQQGLGGQGPTPAGSVSVITDINLLTPWSPPRKFTEGDFFNLVTWLNTNGIYTGNPDRMKYLNMPADEATPNDLRQTPTFVLEGAIPHFGVVINGTGRIFEAEELDLLRPDIDAVRRFVGLS
jgi:hypothetical protein